MRPQFLLALLLLGPAGTSVAAPPGQDPDWPCQQRLVPVITAATYWAGTLPPDDPARKPDARIQSMVAVVASRDTPDDAAKARIDGFATALKPAERAQVLPLAFESAVDAINEQRSRVIDRLEELTRRQHGLADQVGKVSTEVSAIPPESTGAEADHLAEATQRLALLTRSFQEVQRTIRYACDVPAALDARVGLVAKGLQSHL